MKFIVVFPDGSEPQKVTKMYSSDPFERSVKHKDSFGKFEFLSMSGLLVTLANDRVRVFVCHIPDISC